MDLYLVLGFLGSGKTTFLVNFLKYFSGRRLGVIVNDFSAPDVDGKLLAKYTDILSGVTGGSIFCSCRSDRFFEALTEISRQEPEAALIESSGLANPFHMLEVLDAAEKRLGERLILKGVTALADAACFERVAGTARMARMQIACADYVLLNKCDLVSEADAARVEGLLREINPHAKIVRTVGGCCDFSLLEASRHAARALPANIEDLGAQRFLIRTESPVDFPRLEKFCREMSRWVHRIKGFVNAKGKSCLYEYVNGGARMAEGGPPAESYLTLLAVSNRNLSPALDENLAKYLPDWQRAEH